MEEYRSVFKQTWPKFALYLGAGIVVFLLFGKALVWLFAKAAVKVVGMMLIGLGLLFGFFKRRGTTTSNSQPIFIIHPSSFIRCSFR